MSFQIVIGIGAFGGAGATARFMLDGAVAGRLGREFPYGTFVVNMLGAFVLGVVTGAAVGQSASALVETGLVGGFTTFSTWAFESQRLGEEGELSLGALNFAVSLVLGVTMVWAGTYLGERL
jgi:CrcB protein